MSTFPRRRENSACMYVTFTSSCLGSLAFRLPPISPSRFSLHLLRSNRLRNSEGKFLTFGFSGSEYLKSPQNASYRSSF
ncbi:hypothetical protein K469DRAFT_311468 [Zopfia rhizophila CBS 207.26]|uniref:Uncharacterized protein n=1 Tax=Zopfia rhizophila CBS 207.26 TaxID=1314779 RepID=A0A6A6EJW9_9PEZI|nr:hypothetical protein K469DRAFT_311468 [Zopfia rhizophila CBS 207.26]